MSNFINSQFILTMSSTYLQISVKLLQCTATTDNKKLDNSSLCLLKAKSLLDKIPLELRKDEPIYIMTILEEKELESFLNLLTALDKQNKSILLEIDNSSLTNYAVLDPLSSCSALLWFLKDSISRQNISLFNPKNLDELLLDNQHSKLSFFGLDNEFININNLCGLCKNKIVTKCNAICQTNGKHLADLNSKSADNRIFRNKLCESRKRNNKKIDSSVSLLNISERQCIVNTKKNNFTESIPEKIYEETTQLTLTQEVKMTPLISKHFPMKQISPALKSLLGGKILSPLTNFNTKLDMRIETNNNCNIDDGSKVLFDAIIPVNKQSTSEISNLLNTPTRRNQHRNTLSNYLDFKIMSPTQKKQTNLFKVEEIKQKRKQYTPNKLNNKEKFIKIMPNKIDYQRSKLNRSMNTPMKGKIYPKSFKNTPNKNKIIKRTLTNEVRKNKPMLIRHGSKIASNRAEIILQKSKEVAKQRSLNDDSLNKSNNSATESLKRNSYTIETNVASAFQEHTNEEQLLHFLKIAYTKIVEGEGSPFTGSKSIIGACLLFFNENNYDNAYEETIRFVKEYFLRSNSQIQDEYLFKSETFSNEAKLREFELQIFLGFEINFKDEKENNSEHLRIVSILRAMLFMHDPSFLHNYLNSSLLDNYLVSCPNLLHSIYEDLFLPMPPQLCHLCSPSSFLSFDDTEPLDDIILSPKNDSSMISAPWRDFDLSVDRLESRPSHLLRNVSFSQAPRRQIELSMSNLNPELCRRRSDRIASVKKKESMITMVPGQLTDNVRRYLFDDRSLAPKSFTATTEYVTPKKSERLVLKTKKVAETPTSKQGIKRSLKRQEFISRKLTENDIKAVANTPGKELLNIDFLASSQPIGESKKSLFYSTKADSSKSRSINRYQSLEQRMTSISVNQNLIMDLFNRNQIVNSVEKLDVEANCFNEFEIIGSNNLKHEAPNKSFTSPRRVTARVLFAPVLSPTPEKRNLFSPSKGALVLNYTPKKSDLVSPTNAQL